MASRSDAISRPLQHVLFQAFALGTAHRRERVRRLLRRREQGGLQSPVLALFLFEAHHVGKAQQKGERNVVLRLGEALGKRPCGA